MPKKSAKKKREKAKWQGYVNFNPNHEERAAIRARLLSSDKVVAYLGSLADDGYRVSVKVDAYRDSLVLEVYGQWADGDNPGQTLVVAHNDLLVAASAVAFFIDEISDAGVWPSQTQLSDPYDW